MVKLLIAFIILGLSSFSSVSSTQKEAANFQLVWKITGATQAEADQKLARHFAPFVEAEGFADGLCLKNPDGTCQKDEQGAVLYDLGKVSETLEQIIRTKIDTAAKSRFVAGELEKARRKAEEDSDKKEKPTKTAATRSPN